MSDYRELLWMISSSRKVTFTKIQSTYGETLSKCLKIKEGMLTKSDILFTYKIGVISIRENIFTEQSALLIRDFKLYCETSAEPPEVIIGICSRDTNNEHNNIEIPLFRAPQVVSKSDIIRVKNIKFEIHLKISKTELTLAHKNGIFRLCKANKDDIDF